MSHARRLPVYILIDCSESMTGPAFDGVQAGLNALVSELSGDPTALETVWISVISFSGRARVVAPLTELMKFKTPRLTIGSGTCLGAALELLVQRLNTEVQVQTRERKGDWKPIVFLLTDGDPTDAWSKSAEIFAREVTGRRANVVAIACGPRVKHANLRQIASSVLTFKSAEEPSFKELFAWVSQSVKTVSTTFVNVGERGVNLPSLPESMEMTVEGPQTPVADQVFILARCGRGAQLYLMRYEQIPAEEVEELPKVQGLGLPSGNEHYLGVASYPLEDFDFAEDMEGLPLKVSSGRLAAHKNCPHCGNDGWAKCGHCDRVFCIAGGGRHECPWCRKSADYSFGTFDVGRRLG